MRRCEFGSIWTVVSWIMSLMLIRGAVPVSWMRLSGLRNPGIFHQQVSLCVILSSVHVLTAYRRYSARTTSNPGCAGALVRY